MTCGERLHRTLRNYLHIVELDQTTVAPAAAAGAISTLQIESTSRSITRTVATRHKRESDLQTRIQPCRPNINLDALELITEELTNNAFGFSRHGTPV
jgi:hypothetical protein